jgi:hypothetical protein
VIRSGTIRPWVLANIVRDIVFVAAVNAPLLCTAKQWYFEQDSFVASCARTRASQQPCQSAACATSPARRCAGIGSTNSMMVATVALSPKITAQLGAVYF